MYLEHGKHGKINFFDFEVKFCCGIFSKFKNIVLFSKTPKDQNSVFAIIFFCVLKLTFSEHYSISLHYELTIAPQLLIQFLMSR